MVSFREMGVGRRTRGEIVKWDHMTVLRVQTEGRHLTSPASLWGRREKDSERERERGSPMCAAVPACTLVGNLSFEVCVVILTYL